MPIKRVLVNPKTGERRVIVKAEQPPEKPLPKPTGKVNRTA